MTEFAKAITEALPEDCAVSSVRITVCIDTPNGRAKITAPTPDEVGAKVDELVEKIERHRPSPEPESEE